MSNGRHFRRIGIALLVLVLSLGILCLLSGFPSISAEMAFRRKEKQNMIGPAEILAALDFSHSGYDHILIGESAYGYTFFEYSDFDLDDGTLTYVPKNGRTTLYCTKDMYGSADFSASWLPIFAFTEQNAAVIAKLTLRTTQNGESVDYFLESTKQQEGYFMFQWKTIDLRSYDYWLVQQMIAGQYREYVLDGTAQATLELYDKNGNLLETFHFAK